MLEAACSPIKCAQAQRSSHSSMFQLFSCIVFGALDVDELRLELESSALPKARRTKPLNATTDKI